MVFGATAPKSKVFGPQISPILPTGALHNDRNHSRYADTGWNQTYLSLTTHFGEPRRVFCKSLSGFGATVPKSTIFGPHISPILPTGALHNDINQSKYAVTGWNQTYLSITTHFGEHTRVLGKLLSDFWSNTPKTDDFCPQISPFSPNGASQNSRNQSKYAVTGWNQTYLSMTTHFGEHSGVFCKSLNGFWGNSPKI